MPNADGCVSQAQSHIKHALPTIQSPRDVAEAIGVPYHTLRTRFRREIGTTLGRYIRRSRVDRARSLLVGTDEPVYAVCQRVGSLVTAQGSARLSAPRA